MATQHPGVPAPSGVTYGKDAETDSYHLFLWEMALAGAVDLAFPNHLSGALWLDVD